MPTLANRSSFSFRGSAYTATSVSVDAATPEIVNMTAVGDPVGAMKMVPTGAYTSPGRISVECLGFADPIGLVGTTGDAVLSTSGTTITKRVVCESASVEARVGDLLRLRFSLMPTDYTG